MSELSSTPLIERPVTTDHCTEPSVVVAAALPPPLVGQSLASVMLVRQLAERGVPHEIVDLTRPIEHDISLSYVLRRASEVGSYAFKAALAARRLQPPIVFYLQLAQSHRGMLRDLPMLSLAATRGWPTVLHLHGGTWRTAWESAPTPLRLAMQRLVGSASRVVVLEPRLRDMFDGVVAPDRLRVVANSVEASVSAAARQPARRPADGALTVLFLSNLMEPKGYVTVLEAARLCAARGLPHRFVFVGARCNETVVDPDAFAVEHGLDNIEYLGPLYGDAKLAILEQAHVFALPSAYQEGQPISILEAMHFGLPVVASRSGGIPDMFDSPEQQELLVPVRDPEAIVERLVRLADTPGLYNRVAQANFTRAGARYSEQAHGAAMLEVLREAAAEARDYAPTWQIPWVSP